MRTFLSLVLACTAGGAAGAAPPAGATATLSVIHTSRRVATVSLVVLDPGRRLPDPSADLRDALAGAFELDPGTVSVQSTAGVWSLNLAIRPGAPGQPAPGECAIDLARLLAVLKRLGLPALQVSVMLPDRPGME